MKVPVLRPIILLCCFLCGPYSVFSEGMPSHTLVYPELVSNFYNVNTHKLFWFGATSSSELRAAALRELDSCVYRGLPEDRYSLGSLKNIIAGKDAIQSDSENIRKLDIALTDIVITYCKDIYQGFGISKFIKYDEWSGKYADVDNDFIIRHLSAIKTADELSFFLRSLEPSGREYNALKSELGTQISARNAVKEKQLAISINFYRWIHHFKFTRLIEVNAAAATLHYYENDIEVLFSRAIVGKPSTRTPRFAASCNEVVLYPYWNVPRTIAVKELLPKYKRSPSLVNAENMQLIDGNGKIVNPYSVKWSNYNRNYFPFRLRQATGCDNSLGVIKLNLTSPFDVYLHDTNAKGLFNSANRHRSHGCMRIEKAIELGNYILDNKLDTNFVQACMKGEQPVVFKLNPSVPVFVVYLPAEVNEEGTVIYLRDIYKIFGLN